MIVGKAIPVDSACFAVKIEEDEFVAILKEKVKEEIGNLCKDIDARDLQLFNAKKLKDEDVMKKLAKEEISAYLQEEMNTRKRLAFYFSEKDQPEDDEIHVLVKIPHPTSQTELLLPEVSVENAYKRKRWDALNKVIERHKKAKVKGNGNLSIPYSEIRWGEIEEIYRPCTAYYNVKPTPIDDKVINGLYSCVECFTGVFGSVVTGKESKRLYFIAPILAYVCYLFDGNVEILVEETVNGKEVKTNGRFEFVIRSGNKRVCIVEAKKDDMEQGLAQNLMGCEALADVEKLQVVCGIVTNYFHWIIFRSEKENIFQREASIALGEHNLPTKESLKDIAEMIYSVLLEA